MSDMQAVPIKLVFGRAAVLVPAAFALLLGAFLVWGVGFAGAPAIHGAAHDVRHSFAFPCH